MPCLKWGEGVFVQKFVVGRYTKTNGLGTWNGVTGRAFGAGCVSVIPTVFEENVSILVLRA
jgi:hypothetical protein